MEIRQVRDDVVVLECAIQYRGKSQSYCKEETRIQKMLDKHGQVVEGVWEPGWTMVAPGVETGKDQERSQRDGNRESVQTTCLRIARDACPVSIPFLHLSESIEYDGTYSRSGRHEY